MLELRIKEDGLQAMRNRLCARIQEEFDRLLNRRASPQSRLFEAMHYGVSGGGKRLRPLLVLATGQLFGVPEMRSVRAGLAVEAIHAHSLIHDDLPCMDDDDLRRGRPTLHRAFDEATAVLAGDSLLALAFETLAHPDTHPDPCVRTNLVSGLAVAAGPAGMAGGQMVDMLAPGLDLDLQAVAHLQRLKTGALLAWSVDAGALLGQAPVISRRWLAAYSAALGLVFQIADDLLDHEGDESRIGKRVGKDSDAGKATFVSLLGAERARQRGQELVTEAKRWLDPFGPSAEPLRAIADFALSRDH